MATAAELSGAVTGLVVALEANYCRVVLDHPGPGDVRGLLCTRRRRLEIGRAHV